MSESSRRAVLLARPGAACERLRSALADAGANVVLEADPTTLQLDTLGQVSPQVVVVALDPVTEDVIERFDPVLADPSVEVIYEEAALAATREGWDLARWVRHLAAKLHGHGDVLPPGHEPEGMEPPEPPVAVAPQVVEVAPPAVEVAAPAEPPRVVDVSAAPPQIATQAVETIEIASLIVEPVVVPVAATPVAAVEVATPAVEAAAAPVTQYTHESRHNPFDPVAAEASFDVAEAIELPPSLAAVELSFAADAPTMSVDEAELVIEPFESSFDFEIADAAPTPVVLETSIPEVVEMTMDAPAAEALATVTADAPVLMFDASREGTLSAAPRAEVAAPAAPDWSFADDTPAAHATREADPNHKFQRDLGDIERRISALELVEERPVSQFGGAVLVLAGIGGPDAVRQLLGGLPAEFPRPVLVQQRLDGGRYDRLVAQMQRATPLQVRLAEPGLFAMAGTIYILPAEISITVSESGMRFVEGDGDVLAVLPTADSAVLMLSGADAAQVDGAMNLSWAGGLVAGQAPDGCYDAAAASALIARGAQSGQPAELAARLAERWR
ncbi:hypothetical protein JI752_004850 [Lysobacter sp. MMG2]|uniref:chemotaxis protein CheB n=1 Tax=Lysobacter sp. MMG2 TaxID=2801338 RepID=UPI001C233BAB|nr:chemotaxis protein CheB [Lysobacter sp. MMG2]MBU8975462.1 hypothetical protein [Lysobacter sp. MMG2]